MLVFKLILSFRLYFRIILAYVAISFYLVKAVVGIRGRTLQLCYSRQKQHSSECSSVRRKEKACTCSTGLRPDKHLAGKEGGQRWLEPAISSWYHCSKSSLDR